MITYPKVLFVCSASAFSDHLSPAYRKSSSSRTLRTDTRLYENSFQFLAVMGGRQHHVVEPLRLRSADLVEVATEEFAFVPAPIRSSRRDKRS